MREGAIAPTWVAAAGRYIVECRVRYLLETNLSRMSMQVHMKVIMQVHVGLGPSRGICKSCPVTNSLACETSQGVVCHAVNGPPSKSVPPDRP